MRLEFLLIIGLLMACDKPAVAPGDRANISRESAEGFRLLQQGRTEEALALLQRAAEKDSAMEVHYNMGVAHTHLKEYAKAIAAFERAVELAPENPDAHFALGIALGVEHRQRDAAEHFARAAVLAPDRAEYHFRLGEARQVLGEVEGALAAFAAAIRVDSTHVDAHFLRAGLLAWSNRPEEAEKGYRRAIKLDSRRADILWELGPGLYGAGPIPAGCCSAQECS